MTASPTKSPARPRGSDITRLRIYSEAAKASHDHGMKAALKVIAHAVEQGEINERQGKNMVKLVEISEHIRRQAAPTPIEDAQGHMLGEIRELPDGRWNALRYGPEVRQGGVIVATAAEAMKHVQSIAGDDER